MKQIRVVVACPSPVARSRLARTMNGDPTFSVVGWASNLSEAFTLSESLEPDIVLIAEEFFLVDEFDCMRSLFYAQGSIFVRLVNDANLVDRYGNVPTKNGPIPEPLIHSRMSTEEIRAQLVSASSIVRVPRSGRNVIKTVSSPSRSDKLVLIGASTGGIDALLNILGNYPADCPPTAIVQHTGQNFSDSLLRLFARNCAAEVVSAQDRLPLIAGRVCLAGGSKGHLNVRTGNPLSCYLEDGPPVSGHLPSVDQLFRSATPIATRVVGVLLTGMGQDGAKGLLELRKAGAITIGQDADTSTVYGMPKVAWEIGAVSKQVPLADICTEILAACSETTSRQALSR